VAALASQSFRHGMVERTITPEAIGTRTLTSGATMKKPVVFVIVAFVSFAVGVGVALFVDGFRIAARDKQIARDRIALGIDKASPSVLTELSNQELEAASAQVIAKLRKMCSSYESQQEQIVSMQLSGQLDDKTAAERANRLLSDTSYEFNSTIRSDTFFIDNEIRNRIGPNAVERAIAASPSARSVSGSQTSADSMCELADQMDQMAKLLRSN
jgi:hypothetical protein